VACTHPQTDCKDLSDKVKWVCSVQRIRININNLTASKHATYVVGLSAISSSRKYINILMIVSQLSEKLHQKLQVLGYCTKNFSNISLIILINFNNILIHDS